METIVLIIGVVALLIAVMTRWSVVAGLVALGAFITYFWVLNTGTWLTMTLFALGIVLLILELLLPTFGLLALLGAGAVYGSFYLSNGSWQAALVDGTVGLIIGAVNVYILTKLGYRLPLTKRLVLKTANHPVTPTIRSDHSHVRPHLTATTLTALHPVGKIRLESGRLIDARAETGYIEAGITVEVIDQHQTEWVVRQQQ